VEGATREEHQRGKLAASSNQRTEAGDTKTFCLTVIDKRDRIRYLIDTGSDISVLSKTATRDKYNISKYRLYAANNTPITTYGTKLVQVDLRLRRKLDWTFIVPDIKQTIIGADFLAHYGLIVDLRRRSLRDGTTSLKTNGILSQSGIGGITTFDYSNSFADLLHEFSSITKPINFQVHSSTE